MERRNGVRTRAWAERGALLTSVSRGPFVAREATEGITVFHSVS